MVTNIARHVVPAGAFTAHPHLSAELTRLDEALTVAYAALTGPDMPDPIVTLHTSTLSHTSRRKRYHWSATCEHYRTVKARVTATLRMSEMYARECRWCRKDLPLPTDGDHTVLFAEIERHWSLQRLWTLTEGVLDLIEDGCLEDSVAALAWGLFTIGRPAVGAGVLDAFADVVAAAYDLTDPTGTDIRDSQPPDNAAVEAARAAATVTAAARLAGHFTWSRHTGFLTLEEGQPAIDLDLRVLGIPGLHPAFVEDPTQPAGVRPKQLEPAYTAWLAALEDGADFAGAATAAHAAHGDLPEPRLSQLPEIFPVTRGADQVSLAELLAHWRQRAEHALTAVFTEWARSTQAELDRWAPLGNIDITLPGFMSQNGLQAVSKPLARTFPTRYDPQIRAQVITVPAIVAAWLDRPMALHRFNLRLVPARQDTAAVADTFRRLRGGVHQHGRVVTTRMSVEDALMAARGINDITLITAEPGTVPSTGPSTGPSTTRAAAAHPIGTTVPT